jgi:serine/threonine-protein kinase RsbW
VDSERGDAKEDVVHLTVPADARYLPLVRLTGSALASRLGFSVDSVDDIRIAVDELVAVVVSSAVDGSALELEFILHGGHLAAVGRAPTDANEPPRPSELTQKILEAVIDNYELTASDGYVRFRLEKRGETPQASA